ncbi:hypothetical protein NBRC116593_14620 [Sulfitobacter pacificus]
MPPPQSELESYFSILEKDANECYSNLFLLETMARTARKYGLVGGYADRALFDRIALNAQSLAMISLSRLLDDGPDAISVKKLRKKQELCQPENAKELRKAFNTDIHDRLKVWRDNLLAHSLSKQVNTAIPNSNPLTPKDLGCELSVCLQIVHAYASRNDFTVNSLPDSFDHDADFLWVEVESMVCGIFSINPD